MENTKQFFDSWIKSQSRIIDGLTDMARKYQESFWGLGAQGGGTSAFGGFPNVYTSWTSAVLDAMRQTGAGDVNLMQEVLSKTLSGSNAYLNLYQLWLPLFKAIRDKSVSPDTYKDLTDPKKYKEMLDRVFGFDPDVISQIAVQTAKSFEALTGTSQQFMKPWMEAAEKNLKDVPHMMEGRPEAYMQTYHTLFNAFDSTFGRIFHIPPVGKDREKVELLLRSFDHLSVYLAKTTEYQHTMYITGMAALEKVITSITEKMNRGEDIKGFDEFFDLWVDVSEKTFFDLFQSAEFSQMQGELLETALKVRQHNFKLMELCLYDYPVALRSEMDSLYKTIYELKKKVKNLEKQAEEVTP
jgi:class III poly(R)-hydroxyalkanoic acid synthase PhaE subunit